MFVDVQLSGAYNYGMATDYYEMLGVERDAPSQDIKRAFRKIARECHPDVSGGDAAAEERFKKARIAYDTLMDPVTRARYDRRDQRRSQMRRGGSFFDAFYKATGEAEARSSAAPRGGRYPERAAGGAPRGARARKNDPRNNLGLDDLFSVGGEFGFGGKTQAPRGGRGGTTAPPPTNPVQGNDVELQLDVPSDVAQRGGSVTAVYYRMQRADSWRPGTTDPGLVRVQDIADIRIIPGTRNGSVLRERGLGDAGGHGGRYGDLVARVRLVAPQVASAPPPRRESSTSSSSPRPPLGVNEETMSVDIGVVEALLGGRISMDTPQGKVRMTIPPGTSSGTRLRLKGKGSPQANGEIADLYVELRITVPRSLDEESRRLIEEFAKLNP